LLLAHRIDFIILALQQQRHLGACHTDERTLAAQRADMGKNPSLIRSFFKHPSVAYIYDC